jgi:hypothetical protein
MFQLLLENDRPGIAIFRDGLRCHSILEPFNDFRILGSRFLIFSGFVIAQSAFRMRLKQTMRAVHETRQIEPVDRLQSPLFSPRSGTVFSKANYDTSGKGEQHNCSLVASRKSNKQPLALGVSQFPRFIR